MTNSTHPTTRRPGRRRLAWILTLAAVLLGGSVAYAIAALNVDLPLLPAVGQATAAPCDPDGVKTAFTYGNTSANGVKVTSVTVNGISSECATATVEFVKAGAVIDTYSGPVTAGTFTKATTIFTNQFDDVRVSLLP